MGAAGRLIAGGKRRLVCLNSRFPRWLAAWPHICNLQGDDMERILTVWGADLVSNALAMGLDKVTGTVMPRMVFSKLSTYVKRVVEQVSASHGSECSSLLAGIAVHESVVQRHLR